MRKPKKSSGYFVEPKSQGSHKITPKEPEPDPHNSVPASSMIEDATEMETVQQSVVFHGGTRVGPIKETGGEHSTP